VIGHSYGADTAFSVVRDTTRAVDILVSIDPVGRFRPAWTTIRAKARVWLNVRAEPSAERRTLDDTISWIGGQYPRPPARGQAGAPDFAIVANATHGAFRIMMDASTAGRSGRQLLGGNPV
jgi:pimeloyl-ACP methyl ester carboxylesterase